MEQANVYQKKRKKRKKAPIIIAIIVVILFVLIKLVGSVLSAASATVLVTTTTATRGELQESISTSGMVESEEKKVVFAPVTGVIGEVKVAAGDAVKAGDMLISYSMEDMEDMLKQATLQQEKTAVGYQSALNSNQDYQAKLAEANTNLAVLEQQIADHEAYLDTLQDKYSNGQRETSTALINENYNLTSRSTELQNRLAELKAGLNASADDYESKMQEMQQIEQQLQEVNSQMARNQYLQQIAGSSEDMVALEKEIASVQENLAKMEAYKAEMESQKSTSENMLMDNYDKQQYAIDNELSNMSFQATEEDYKTASNGVTAVFDGIVTECTAVQGATVSEGMQLLTLENSKELKVTFSATKYDIEKLEIGQKVEVEISKNTYDGEISKINRMASLNTSGSTMVGVEVHINNPDEKIILGMDAKLTIFTNKAEDALMIPVEVINADKQGDFLYVVENGVIVRKAVVCGISTDTHTEVLEGITEEDQIVVTSIGEIEEGVVVTVMPEGALNMNGAMNADSVVSVSVTTE